MGCDIHIWLERWRGGEWHDVSWEEAPGRDYGSYVGRPYRMYGIQERCYGRFATLAGVRTHEGSPKQITPQRGCPEDSPNHQWIVERQHPGIDDEDSYRGWLDPDDYHSHSWLYFFEMQRHDWSDSYGEDVLVFMDWAMEKTGALPTELRIVFAFDN